MPVTGNIFDLKKFAIHDGPGIRTTVFFKGCPLECWWCHNPEGMNAEAECADAEYRRKAYDLSLPLDTNVIGPNVAVDTLMAELRKDSVFYMESGGGVTMSGGEPLMQHDFLVQLLDRCVASGIDTAVDTSGYAPWEELEEIIPLVTLFLYDIKLIDDELHTQYTGVSNGLILENLHRLCGAGGEITIRVPLIPGITDTDSNLHDIVRFLEPFERIEHIGLLPYNRIGEDKFERLGITYKPGRRTTQDGNELERIAGLFEQHGYQVSIGG
ncbi:MAG: glycyl-radical enzyme activating protein [bacterium]|nr:MAG: glycyl-radical enzyme activating protein [bacterium]